MNKRNIHRKMAAAKRRMENRLRRRSHGDTAQPVLTAGNIHYEPAERNRGIAAGGIGAMHLLARQVGLIEALDAKVHVLKQHKPYHESDHILSMAYNLLAGGTRIEHLEQRRQDQTFLDALGAQRIPDPTTAGDFCRRFDAPEIQTLMETINDVRVPIWQQQSETFFAEAVLDVDGTLTETTGECKEGMDISYNGKWGYHPLVLSLANTGEPLYLVNRSGNRPSHEDAAEYIDRAAALCRRSGFRKITVRGDTDFTQTAHLDRWAGENLRFIFGVDARPNLVQRAESLEKTAWRPLVRSPRYEVKTKPRRRPAKVKQQKVVQREFENIRLLGEEVAEFSYRPTACRKEYRMIVVKKHLCHLRGKKVVRESCRYFFYITNDQDTPAAAIVAEANGRCNQENLIEQLKNGVRAMVMPLQDLMSNWAYLVIASLAWTLKAWAALLLPETGRWAAKHQAEKQTLLRMEFRTFLGAWIQIPCQIVRTGRRIVYRFLSWNPWQAAFFRLVQRLRHPLRC